MPQPVAVFLWPVKEIISWSDNSHGGCRTYHRMCPGRLQSSYGRSKNLTSCQTTRMEGAGSGMVSEASWNSSLSLSSVSGRECTTLYSFLGRRFSSRAPAQWKLSWLSMQPCLNFTCTGSANPRQNRHRLSSCCDGHYMSGSWDTRKQ